MSECADLFIRKSSSLLIADYLPKIEHSVGCLSDELVWRRPNQACNSVGNLLLHLRGNVSQWIIGGVARRPNKRRRAEEFDERGPLPAEELLQKLRVTVEDAAHILDDLDPASLTEQRRIQGYDVTVLEAIYHVVEHFGMHTGQIILLTKVYTGDDLKLWRPPLE